MRKSNAKASSQDDQRVLKTSRTDSLSLSHCLMGNLCYVLCPVKLSVHVVHLVLWQNSEPWAMHPVGVKELHLVNVLPAKTSKLCSPSMGNMYCLEGVWNFLHKGQKMMLFPPEKDRRIINFLPVWFTWRHLKDILSFLLDLRAWLCILPAGFLTRIFLSCDSFCEGKKKHNLSCFPKIKINSKHIRIPLGDT